MVNPRQGNGSIPVLPVIPALLRLAQPIREEHLVEAPDLRTEF
jgi:hypothetical protein